MRRILATSFVLFVLAFPAFGQERPVGYVTDEAGILSVSTKNTLEETLRHYETTSTNEVVVVTVSSLDKTTIEEKAVSLFEKWGIGKKGKDNGLLLLIAPNEREVRIEVGYGLEGVMTDAQSGIIIRSVIVPAFKEGKYDEGVTSAVTTIIDVLGGKELVEQEDFSWILLFLIFGFLLFFIILSFHLRGVGGGFGPGGFSGGGFGGGFGGGGFGGFGGGGSGGGGSSGRW